MRHTKAVQDLQEKLALMIEAFFAEAQEELPEAYEAMGWVGNDLARLMAKSAMATWEASADVQEFMKANEVRPA